MGKFFNKFKETSKKLDESVGNYSEKVRNRPQSYNGKIKAPIKQDMGNMVDVEEDYVDEPNNLNEDGLNDDLGYDDYNQYGDDVNIQQAQKPESFHHFLLENKYQDLEGSIRGLKKVWDKENQKYVFKRKKLHCFTDEEAEDILRTAQVHLSTDIKLASWNKETFGTIIMTIYNQLDMLFKRRAEYHYGRYNDFDKNGKLIRENTRRQGAMKEQNLKIFKELMFRIMANYSMGIAGQENKATHGSVRGQESLQSGERDYTGRDRGY